MSNPAQKHKHVQNYALKTVQHALVVKQLVVSLANPDSSIQSKDKAAIPIQQKLTVKSMNTFLLIQAPTTRHVKNAVINVLNAQIQEKIHVQNAKKRSSLLMVSVFKNVMEGISM